MATVPALNSCLNGWAGLNESGCMTPDFHISIRSVIVWAYSSVSYMWVSLPPSSRQTLGSSFIRPSSCRGWLTRPKAQRRFFGSVSALVVSTNSS